MKKPIYFENSNVFGFEVTTVNEVIKAQELGLWICNEDEYYFNEYVVEQNEEGIETERVATEDECMERILNALKEGQKLYITLNINDCGMKVVKNSATILTSDFYIGQTVYTMQENKIVSGTILFLSLSKSKDNDKVYTDVRAKYLIEKVYKYCAAQSQHYCKDFISLDSCCMNDVKELVRESVNGNSVVLYIGGRKEARNMSEIFATKEELINSLLNK